jgi:hypothetical protein
MTGNIGSMENRQWVVRVKLNARAAPLSRKEERHLQPLAQLAVEHIGASATKQVSRLTGSMSGYRGFRTVHRI